MEKQYNVVNGTSYNVKTSQSVINVLEMVRHEPRKRIRVYYGDIETGKCWNEEHDIFGYVGRSTGINKIPLLISNKRSFGGGALLDHCIIKIKESKGNRVLFQSANFQQPICEVKESSEAGYSHCVYIDGSLYSNHKSFKSAETLAKKMS